jgi:4-amino-4-deoxy-L-arabinose transferase-like glycosyltransferase
MHVSAPTTRFLGLSPAAAAALVIAVATAFRLFYCTWLPMLPDETYYYQWSQHLDASYISKGPAVAYTIALGTLLFGKTHLGVRFFAVLLSAGTAWQIFLLARRWYDDTTALMAVLLAGVIPLYAVGAVLMTIDPLSAFFWVWAANLFSSALRNDRLLDWLLTGFAVGSGFLAKYLNALELVAFIAFLLLIPARRRQLLQPGFWSMIAVALVCTSPVLWWNQRHHWTSWSQLGDRGHLNVPFHLQIGTILDFLGSQAVVISPLLFLALLFTAGAVATILFQRKPSSQKEGECLLLLLFLSVFLFYAVLALHLRCEPNWPAVSYLSLLILLASRWRTLLASRLSRVFLVLAFCVAWLETVILHDTSVLPLPRHMDPMGRTAGWSQVAGEVARLQQQQRADVLLADGYKEASVLAFEFPNPTFVYALKHSPPANQFDLWPTYPTEAPHRVLWVSDYATPTPLKHQFASIAPVEQIHVLYRGSTLRTYYVFLCENHVGN